MLREQKLKGVPAGPGVYMFKDAKGEILYIGKAKSLRSRVRSYFRENADLDAGKSKMVDLISDVETIVCDTEMEAVVLEANLIHKHQPPYNILLRDDKFYLFIKVTVNESVPRVFPVRKLKKDGARYFGPYSSAASVRETLRLLRRVFPHKAEKERPRDKVFPHPLFNADASYGSADYEMNINNIINFLKGRRETILETLRRGMDEAARRKEYERAAAFRDQINAVERLEGSQKVYLAGKESFDIVSVISEKSLSAANVFLVRDGKLLVKNTFLLRNQASSKRENILRQFMLQYYRVAQDKPQVVYVPTELGDQEVLAKYINEEKPSVLRIPRRGKKKELMEMGEKNARHLLEQEKMKFDSEEVSRKAVVELAKALGLGPVNENEELTLKRVETYDISNLQGKTATGSMVVFTEGQPDKSQYRKFRIKTKESPDDYKMMEEVLRRRFKNTDSASYERKPDLVLLDGSRGQLNVGVRVMKEYGLNIPLAAVAKREEEIFVPDKKDPVRLPVDSPALFLVQRMRDEAHRFTVSYHRLLRSKQQQRSILDEIPDIGPKSKKKLLNSFGSLKKIRAASEEDLEGVIGKAKTKQLRDWL